MKIFNYSKLKQNDKKIYNIAGYPIPGGIDISIIISGTISTVLINLIFYPILSVFGVPYFDFGNGQYMLGFFMIVGSFIIGVLIGKVKIGRIPIYQYIIEAAKQFVKPKNISLRGEKSSDKEMHINFKIDDPI